MTICHGIPWYRNGADDHCPFIIEGWWLFFYPLSYLTLTLLRYLFLSISLIPIINFSVWVKQEKGTFLMCVVFLCITATHGNDESPLAFAIDRIIDTTIGIFIALFINQFPKSKM